MLLSLQDLCYQALCVHFLGAYSKLQIKGGMIKSELSHFLWDELKLIITLTLVYCGLMRYTVLYLTLGTDRGQFAKKQRSLSANAGEVSCVMVN